MNRWTAGAAVFVALMLPVGAIGLIQYQAGQQTVSACVDRKHTYDALHELTVQQNKVQPASPIILKAFPEFKPFFTPGTPEFNEAARIADVRRDAVLNVLGDRPSC